LRSLSVCGRRGSPVRSRAQRRVDVGHVKCRFELEVLVEAGLKHRVLRIAVQWLK
jgi:hypothetical protein